MSEAAYVVRPADTRGFWLGLAAYVLATFPVAIVWHLVLFEQKYRALQIYRDEPVIAFGLGSMIIQGAIFSWLFPRVFAKGGSVLGRGCCMASARACCRGLSPRSPSQPRM